MVMTPEEMVSKMRPWAARRASAILPAQEVEDAVQEALIACWQAMDRLDPNRDPWPLLTMAARSRIGRYAHKYYERTPLPVEHEDEAARYDGTEEQALQRIQSNEVRAAINSLSPRERDAVILVDLLDVPPEGAARRLGLNPKAGALRQARRRAHEKLREALIAA